LHKLRHVGIACKEVDQSLVFWRDLLGFEVFWDKVEPEPYISELLGFAVQGLRTIKLKSISGDVVELLHFSAPNSDNQEVRRNLHTSIGLTHLAFTVPDIHTLLERLTSAGYRSFARPLSPPNGSVLVSYVKGPDNVLLELVEDLPVPL
jgi:catechol 2,3-dioxygenase-like lactoylglutathione lyase family enzyme